jgi:CRISPR-associated protein (TIGR02584 family)
MVLTSPHSVNEADESDEAWYPRRILCCVTGLSPQVVTETIYALAHPSGSDVQPWHPTELHIVTTTVGQVRVRQRLLGEVAQLGQLHPAGNQLTKLIADYDLPPITFSEAHIHVVEDYGVPMADIQTRSDYAVMADYIMGVLRNLCGNANTSVHVSLAGGRKSMSFLMGYCLSLLGRPQDTLSHVLVSAPYEQLPDFFYPPPQPQYAYLIGQEAVDLSQAKITLETIPILKLGVPSTSVEPNTPSTMLAQCYHAYIKNLRHHLTPQWAEVYYEDDWELTFGGQKVGLDRKFRQFYTWLKHWQSKHPNQQLQQSGDDWQDYHQFLFRLSEKYPAGKLYQAMDQLQQEGWPVSYFDECKSRINRVLRRHYPMIPVKYHIHRRGSRGKSGLCIPYYDEALTIKDKI